MNKLELKDFLLLFLTNIDETIDISELGYHLGEFSNNKRYKRLFRNIKTKK